MADNVSFQMRGVPELKKALAELPRTLRRKVLMKGLRAAAKVVLAVARHEVPVLAEQTPYRKPGTVKKALTIRTSKVSRQAGNVGVFVNVKPLSKKKLSAFKASAAAQGRRWSAKFNRDDPYYWRWLEFGHRIVGRSKKTGQYVVSPISYRNKNGTLVRRGVRRDVGSLRSKRLTTSGGAVAARPFLRPAAQHMDEAFTAFEQEVVPAIEALNR